MSDKWIVIAAAVLGAIEIVAAVAADYGWWGKASAAVSDWYDATGQVGNGWFDHV